MRKTIQKTPEEALRASVDAIGGLQEIGAALKGADADPVLAGQWLSHCLTADKRDKLSLSQIVHVFRRAHGAGEHDGFAVFAQLCGYQVTPVGFDAQLADVIKRAQVAAEAARRAAEDVESLSDNPELLARMKAAGLKVEALA